MGLRYVAEGATPETALLPDGLAVRAEFYQDGYEGSATTLDLVQQGLSKRYVMRDFIADAEVSVTLDDRAGGQPAGFFDAITDARDREWRLVTFVGGAEDWEGYLLPRRVGRTLEESGKRIVTVQAKSRFSELGNLPADEALTGTLSLAEITRRLLQPLAPFDVEAATDWYPVVDGDTFTDEPFGQLTIDTGSLQDDDGQPFTQAAALRQTHRRLQAKLIQEGGVWHVYQDERLTEGSIRITTFDDNGSATSTENRVVDLEADGRTVTAQSRNPGSAGQLRQQAVRYNHGTIGGQLLSNLDFRRTPQTTSGDGLFQWRPADSQGHEYRPTANAVRVNTTLVNTLGSTAPSDRYWQQFGGQIVGGPARRLTIGFDAFLAAVSDQITANPTRIFYRVKVGSHFLDQNANVWTTSVAENPRTVDLGQGDVSLDITTPELTDGGSPVSGQLEIRLYAGYVETDDLTQDPGYVEYSSFRIALVSPDDEGELTDPEARLSTVQEIDTLGSEVAPEEAFAVGDGPTTIHASRLRFLTDADDEIDLTDHWDKGPHTTETGTTLDELWATERLQRRRTALTRARVVISSQGPILPAAALYLWQGQLWTWERWTYTANAGDGQQYDILLREHKQSAGDFQTSFAEERLQPFATVGQRREAGVVKFSPLQALPLRIGATITKPTAVDATQWVVSGLGADYEFESPRITGTASTADAATYVVRVDGGIVGEVSVSSGGEITSTVSVGTTIGKDSTLTLRGPSAAADIEFLSLVLHLRQA